MPSTPTEEETRRPSSLSPTVSHSELSPSVSVASSLCSPILSNAKTTMLSSRSQIEILNPNEPTEGVFDSKKSPLALLAATCSNIGRDGGHNQSSGFNKSPMSPVSEIKLTSPSHSQGRSSRLGSETDAKTPGTPPSLIKYMDKVSPIATSSEFAQLQAKFTNYPNTACSAASLSDIYDPSKLAAQFQAKAAAAAAAAYMFPLGLQSLSATLASTQAKASTQGTCQLCPTSQFIAGGGHAPPKPGAGSPYITYLPVKTHTGTIVHVPICADRGCLYCLTAIRQAQLMSTNNNCNHCTHEKPAAQPPSFTTSPLALHLHALQQQQNSILSSFNSTLENSNTHAITSMASSQNFLASFAAAAGAAQSDKLQGQNPADNSYNKCKWAPVGGLPCGKSFSSQDELMDHIKNDHMSATPHSAHDEILRRTSPVTTTASALNSLQSANSLLSLSNLSRKIPGSMELASALGAAARFHPYPKHSATSPASSLSNITPANLNAFLSSSGMSGINPFLLYDLPKA